MAKEDNSKKEIVVAVIVCGLVIAIVIGMVIMKKTNKHKTETEKEQEIVISYDGYELNEDEVEQEAERNFEDDYTSTEVFLGMYGLRKSGKELLYSNKDGQIDKSFLIYESEEDCEAKFKDSGKTINVESKELKLFETGITFEEYKQEALKYMSEDVFNEYFKPYTSVENGMLYITNEDEEVYSLDSFENIEAETYILNYQINGEQKEAEVKIDANERTITQINM